MTIWEIQLVEVFITFIESFLAYQICSDMLQSNLSIKTKIIFSLLLTGIIEVCNVVTLFSIATLAISISFASFSINSYLKVYRFETGLYFYLYYLFVYILDFFAASLLGVVSGQDNLVGQIARELSVERIKFLFLSKALLVFFVFTIKHYKNHVRSINKKKLVFIMCIGTVLAAYLSINTFKIITIEKMFNWFIIFVLMILLYAVFIVYQQYENELMNRKMINIRNELINQQYVNLLEEYYNYAKLHHDSMNHIALISNFLEGENYREVTKYIKEIIKDTKFEQLTWTGNDIIDFIINRKKREAEEAGISYRVTADPITDPKVEAHIINTVLSNLLDNAVEACEKIEKNDRWIHISVRRVNDMVIITIENSSGQIPVIKGQGFKTTKTNKEMHGWGLKSVMSAVKEGGGTIRFSYDNYKFKVLVVFF